MQEGDKFNELVVVDSWSHNETKGEKPNPYTSMSVRTKGQERLEVRRWGEAWDVKTGSVIRLIGKIEFYKGRPQIKAWEFSSTEERPDVFLPRVPDDEHEVNKNIIAKCVKRVVNDSLREFVRFSLKSAGLDYMLATGAIGNHHSMVRGLIKHCAEMVTIAETLSDIYLSVELDKDLVFATIPIHDWGKMEEYAVKGASFVMTDAGRLLSHPGITPWRLAELRAEYNREAEHPLEDGLFTELLHTIGAHHGKVEYNAPSGPKTLPAMVVHLADYSTCFADAFRTACSGGERGTWTDEWIITPDGKKQLRRS